VKHQTLPFSNGMNKFSSKIEEIKSLFDELERDLQDPEIVNDVQKIKDLSKKYNEYKEILNHYRSWEKVDQEITDLKNSLAEETDKEIFKMTEEELTSLNRTKTELENLLGDLLFPKDPLDKKDTIVEIRAGTGGDESALFAADLFRMYSRYAERQKWQTKLISANRITIGGFKEIIFEISGHNVYSNLKYEMGVHRVQRVPETEKSGRIHTSAATVVVMPVAEEIDIKLDPKDLKIETNTSSGHGGQSVNTTYSAIRITHLPTGLVVQCQDERSQLQNKERALQVLRSRLLVMEQEKQAQERSDHRKSQIGTGDRSEKIRTYNFPQDRLTDHRIKLTLHNINDIMDGNLTELIEKLKEADSS
jgi:peptide chain release factor 1